MQNTKTRDWMDGREVSLHFEAHPWVGEVIVSPADATGYPTAISDKETLKDRARNTDNFIRARIAEIDESYGSPV